MNQPSSSYLINTYMRSSRRFQLSSFCEEPLGLKALIHLIKSPTSLPLTVTPLILLLQKLACLFKKEADHPNSYFFAHGLKWGELPNDTYYLPYHGNAQIVQKTSYNESDF